MAEHRGENILGENPLGSTPGKEHAGENTLGEHTGDGWGHRGFPLGSVAPTVMNRNMKGELEGRREDDHLYRPRPDPK